VPVVVRVLIRSEEKHFRLCSNDVIGSLGASPDLIVMDNLFRAEQRSSSLPAQSPIFFPGSISLLIELSVER